MRIVEKSWGEFWAYYWRVDHRHAIPGIFEWDKRLVAFIEQVCQLQPGQRVLDLACGGGDQAAILARKGYDVLGVEIAPPLVAHARERFARDGLAGEFICGDMRAIAYEGEFDAVLVLSGSFGFFGDAGDQALLGQIAQALKPGGKAFIMYVRLQAEGGRRRAWQRVKEGLELTESCFDFETGTMCTWIAIIQDDGAMLRPSSEPSYYTADERIRCYTVPEMRRMLNIAGLEPCGFYGRDMSPEPGAETPRDIVVAVKP
jgi:SAM-dependent methyltransferase